MAGAKVFTGAGKIQKTDTRYIKWIGKTKGGQEIKIEMEKAFCRSDPSWTFAEKDDVTAELEYEGLYTDTNLARGDRTEPWLITIPGEVVAGADEIMLGAGAFYVGQNAEGAEMVALTRGGGSFVVEREIREIHADGDPGAVDGRLAQEEGRPKLKLVALQWITKIDKLYSGMKQGVPLSPAKAAKEEVKNA